MGSRLQDDALAALNGLAVEVPSWGFADTGTRFGRFHQAAAAFTIEQKLEDAGFCHQLTGLCPTVAIHVLWDLRPDLPPKRLAKLARSHGVRIGSINPNLFEEQAYKFGSLAAPSEAVRQQAVKHCLECIEIARDCRSGLISLWLADGTNYPGQDSMLRRKRALQQSLSTIHSALGRGQRLLIEYKPFEPAFYHTDIADWGMAAAFCRHAGARASVLVDTGHHLPGANIEQIVRFLLDEGLLGGFHFNDRKYADDDLTLASIDPYAVFRIFNAVAEHTWETSKTPEIAYMVDQSHNLKPKMQAMVQTLDRAASLFLRAHLVDRKALARARRKTDIVQAERVLVEAFERDVRGLLADWRRSRGLPEDPLAALADSGYIERAGRERSAARAALGAPSGSSYA